MYTTSVVTAEGNQARGDREFQINFKLKNGLEFQAYNLVFYKKFYFAIRKLIFYKQFSKAVNSIKYHTSQPVYVVRLYLKGVGYKFLRSRKFPEILRVELGYSILAYLKVPKLVKVFHKRDKIIIVSSSRFLLSNFSTRVFQIRPADPYKGKGVRLSTLPYVTFKSGKQRL